MQDPGHDSQELQKLTKDWMLMTGRIKSDSVENRMRLKKEGAVACGEGYGLWCGYTCVLSRHHGHIVLPAYAPVSSSACRGL